MAAKSAFRLSTNEKPTKVIGGSRTSQVQEADSTSLVVTNSYRSTNILWQNLTPEMRAEALRRAHLVQLLKQVNPDLQLCRRSTSDAAVQAKPTVEKGVQVPDIRFEFTGIRKPKPRGVSTYGFVGPGVRIQPRPRYNRNMSNNNNTNFNMPRQPQRFPTGPMTRVGPRPPWPPVSRSLLRADAPPHVPRNVRIRAPPDRTSEDAPVRKGPIGNIGSNTTFDAKSKRADEPVLGDKMDRNNNRDKTGKVEQENEKIESEDQKVDDEKLTKPRAASSGDDDSVVVVLNEPKKERDLERKYGQFFCRRCLRGWSSRNVWCVRNTCKVYIKQTCNTCNKVVNPYLVCHLPVLPVKRGGQWRANQNPPVAV